MTACTISQHPGLRVLRYRLHASMKLCAVLENGGVDVWVFPGAHGQIRAVRRGERGVKLDANRGFVGCKRGVCGMQTRGLRDANFYVSGSVLVPYSFQGFSAAEGVPKAAFRAS